ncbi:MAG: hypothetical protein WAL22_17950 [Solirubrobacteraceae bacterium]
MTAASAPPAGAAWSVAATVPWRRRGVDALIVLTTLLTIAATLAVWANRQLLDPGNWSATSTRLLQNPEIRNVTAAFAVDQLYANVDIANLIGSALPKRLRPLAGPAAGALRTGAVRAANLALADPRVQTLWARANRRAAQQLVTVVEGGKGPVKVQGGVVTLDLAPVVEAIASQLGLPAGIGARLPSSIAHVRILQSSQIGLVQDIGRGLRSLALALSIAVPLLFGLAIGLARGRRRRAVMNVGYGLATAGLLVLLGRALLQSRVPAALVPDASIRPAAAATVSIATSMLAEIAGELVLVGALLIIVAWLAGRARGAAGFRRALAPHVRDYPGAAFALLIAVIALVLVWRPIGALGTPVGALAFVGLALLWAALVRQQAASEFPDAQAGDAVAELRDRARRLRGRRGRQPRS